VLKALETPHSGGCQTGDASKKMEQSLLIESNKESSGISEIEKYLQSGEQTQFTTEVRKITLTFEGDMTERVSQIFNWMDSLDLKKSDKVFRKRTADLIVEDGYITGCTDAGLVFVALARASGIPTKYVETIDKIWLKEGGSSVQGHIYAEVYNEEDKSWTWVDPMRKMIGTQPIEDGRVVFKEGLDSWSIGIKDFESLKAAFDEFREKWSAQEELK
jgi:hypothetical protein